MSLAAGRILVTGAGSGIGAAIAAAAAGAGASVAVNDLDPAAAERTVEALRRDGGRAWAVPGDVADPGSARAVVDKAAEELGGLTGLVNNVGVVRGGALATLAPREWDLIMRVDCASALYCAQAARPHLLRSRPAGQIGAAEGTEHREGADDDRPAGNAGRAGSAGGAGEVGDAGPADGVESIGEVGPAIVTISSLCGIFPAPGAGSYNAAKAAVISLTQQLALEWGGEGIRVNAIAPGIVSGTNFSASSQDRGAAQRRAGIVPLGRTARAADIAPVAVFLLSAAAAYMTGQVLVVDGGLGIALQTFIPA